MRKILRATGLALAVGAGLSACYPERASQPTVYNSVTTVYDTLMAFDSVSTFYIPGDSVVHVGGTDDISHVYDSLIVAETRAWMIVRGYTQVFDPDSADLAIHPVVTVTKFDYESDLGDWCAVWGWAYPWVCTGWLPGYPDDIVGYEYSRGTLLLFMADLTGGAPPGANPPVVWVAGINGVLNGNSSAALAGKIVDGLAQAFYQSPYIYRVNP